MSLGISIQNYIMLDFIRKSRKKILLFLFELKKIKFFQVVFLEINSIYKFLTFIFCFNLDLQICFSSYNDINKQQPTLELEKTHTRYIILVTE